MRYHELLESRTDVLDQIVTPGLERLRGAFVAQQRDLRFVGGCVRDILAGKKPKEVKDIDLATDATPEEQIAIYRAAGYKYVPTGIEHGTITVLVDGVPYEITTLRTESEHDGRWAKVAYTRDWVEDLSRRDLTVNAMALTFDGQLIDPFGGQGDLQRGMVRFVGNPKDRMTEDYLRILRFFRFHGRLNPDGFFDTATADAIRERAPGLEGISGERIWMEVAKILAGPNGPVEIKQMNVLGVSKAIGLPTKNIGLLRRTYKLTKHPVTLLCAILDTPDEVKALDGRWKFSGDERMLALFLVGHKAKKLDRRALENLVIGADGQPVPQAWVAELARLHGDKLNGVAIEHWRAPVFPVAGKDLLAFGLPAGPEMGRMLKLLKAKWVDSRFKLTRDDLLGPLRRPEPEAV